MSTLSQAESPIPGFTFGIAVPIADLKSGIANDPHSSDALVSGLNVVVANDSSHHAATRRHQTGSVSPFSGPSREAHIPMPDWRHVPKPRCLLPRQRRLFGGSKLQNHRDLYLPRRLLSPLH